MDTAPDDDREAFLRTIRQHPAADLPRLVFADWLEERGEADHAEFIRVQVEKARLVDAGACAAYAAGRCCRSMDCPLCPLHWRETELCLCGRELPGWFEKIEHETYHLDGAEPLNGPACVVRRGFPAKVLARLEWLIGKDGFGNRRLRKIRSRHPIEVVRVTNRRPFHLTPYRDFRDRYCWFGFRANIGRDGELPDIVFDRLDGFMEFTRDSRNKQYLTASAAVDALSRAIFSLTSPESVE